MSRSRDRVVRALKQMAAVLEIVEAGEFEIMAFARAARELESWQGDLDALVADDAVTTIPGVGRGIGGVVRELVADGRSAEHDRVLGLVPPGVPEMLALPGLGPKRVRAFWKELGIDDVDGLEEAIRSGRAESLRGFGRKTGERVLRAIERRRDGSSPRSAAPAELELPARRSAGRLRCGTSGYAYTEWKGSFYSKDEKTARLLEAYAERLPTVEINNCFYRFPTEKVLTDWASRTPEGFRFAVKANRRVTHTRRLRDLDVTREFVARVALLGDRLGPLLFQLPPDFSRDDERLARFVDGLPAGGRYAIEFRHASWLEPAVLDRLRDAGVALVVHDGRELDCPRESTAEFVYVRLRADAYDDDELDGWRTWIAAERSRGHDVWVYLKHDEAGASPLEVLDRLDPDAAGPRKPARPAARRSKRTGRKRQA